MNRNSRNAKKKERAPAAFELKWEDLAKNLVLDDRRDLQTKSGGTKDIVSENEVDDKVQIEITKAVSKIKDGITANFVTILGIFASFITFLGLEIQILKNICDYFRMLGFSLFVLASVMVFVFSIYIFIDQSNSKGWQKTLGMCFIIFLLLFGGFYCFSKAEDEYVCKLTQLNEKFEQLEIQYSKRNNDSLLQLEHKIESIESALKTKK